MKASLFRDRINVESQSTAVDAAGQRVISWAAVASGVPAYRIDESAREFEAARAMFSEVSAVFVVRTMSMSNEYRILQGATIYDVVGVIRHDVQGRYLRVVVRAGANSG